MSLNFLIVIAGGGYYRTEAFLDQYGPTELEKMGKH
jgi:hypothetical protein